MKLGISLYSWTNEYITYRRSLEDCIKTSHELGFRGLEIVAAQSVPEYPFPSDRWLGEFRDMLAKYEMEPVCWSAYIDNGMRSDRDLTHDEIIQFTQNDLIYAKRAGFGMVRTQHAISPAILEEMIPFCEKLDMQLTVEMHNPHTPEVPVWEEYLELMNGRGKGVLGCVPDFSIFQEYPHELLIDAMLEDGFRPEKLEAMLALVREFAPYSETKALELNALEDEMAQDIFANYSKANLSWIPELARVSPYMHGKFYYLPNGELDPCIPYHKILPEIKKTGFDGYIAAEYEGHHFDLNVDMREQMARYVSMVDGILAKA